MGRLEWTADRLQTLIAGLARNKRESASNFEASIGYPDEVRAELTEGGISVQRCRPHWQSVAHLEIDWVEETYLPWGEIEADEDLVERALQSARRKRIASYRSCKMCRAINPPEYMHDRNTCMRCAERHLGVVY